VFSTATFHWVLDHPRLFRSLHVALKPGGQLVAQCGGAGNLARIHHRTDMLMRDAQFAPYFAKWSEPWEFADAETTAQRLANAGFEDIHTSIEQSPVVFPDADCKFFLVASTDVRARRRHAEDVGRGVASDVEVTRAAIDDRDRRDRERAAAPLRPAADAIVIDTSDLTPNEVVARMVEGVRTRAKA